MCNDRWLFARSLQRADDTAVALESECAASGERTRPACWRARLAIADFALTPALQEMLNVAKDCFGATPKLTRGTRAAPQNQRSARELSICTFADSFVCYMTTEKEAPSDFIRDIIAEDLRTGKYNKIVTRFPPEPNGYLHIGHAKSICLNFGIAREFGGICNIRMDDTNPTKEEAEYVRSIMADVHWLIDGWADKQLGGAPFYASDYFDRFYEYAVELIRKGKAYVDDMTPEETDAYRRLGKASSFRERPVDESLDLFARMKAGEFPDGARTLRAKIDVNAANVWLRDPVLYRIRHATHHRTGDKWCIYPMYDWAHTLSDYIEGITHSICTLEFEVHRPLYDWILDALEIPEPRPHQYEFARFNLTYTVMSKRKLIQLVNEKLVNGWDDPRMLTISGLRRRGVTPTALRSLAYNVGITKYPSMTDMALLEHTVRDELNRTATRRLVVLRPIKVVLTNYPEGKAEELDAINNPEDPNAGTRKIPFEPRALHRARRFHGNATAEILSASTGRRGAAEIRLHHQVRGSRQR